MKRGFSGLSLIDEIEMVPFISLLIQLANI